MKRHFTQLPFPLLSERGILLGLSFCGWGQWGEGGEGQGGLSVTWAGLEVGWEGLLS